MENKILEASIGGDVADLFGNLKRLDTKEEYRGSMNPNSDPFSGLNSAQEMVSLFAKSHANSLEILDQRLDDFYQVKKEVADQELSPTYLEAKNAVKDILSSQKESSTKNIEYHLDSNLEEMANSIKGQHDRFIRLEVQFGNKKPKSFEFAGDSDQLVDKLVDLVKKGNVKVITQSIGTYTEDNLKK